MVKLHRVSLIESYLIESKDLVLESKKDLEDLKDYLGDDLFDSYMDIRDKISDPKFKDFSKLKKMDKKDIQDFVSSFQSKSDKRKQDKIEGAEKIYEDADWIVYKITSYPAAQLYGKGTKWCITGRYEGAESQGEGYFNDYISRYDLDGGYYFYISKKDPDRKYCLLLDKDGDIHSIWSADDTDMRDADKEDLPSDLPNIKGIDIQEYLDFFGSTDSNLLEALKKEIWNDDPNLQRIDRIAKSVAKSDSYSDDRFKSIWDGLYWHNNPYPILKILSKYSHLPDKLYVDLSHGDSALDLVRFYLEEVANKNKYSDDERSSVLKDLSGSLWNRDLVILTPLKEQIKDVIKAGVGDDIDWLHTLSPLVMDDKGVIDSLKKLGDEYLLQYSFGTDTERVLEPLLKNGLSPNFVFSDSDPLLFKAEENNRADMVELLLDYGADPNTKYDPSNPDSYVWLAAIEDDKIDILKSFINHGANIKEWKDEDGDNALAYTDDFETKKLLDAILEQ